jgi:hypothetical protein
MDFEQIDDTHQRAKVFGGWIVKAFEGVYHTENGFSSGGDGWDWRVSMAFVPDPNYEWSICKGIDLGGGNFSGCDASAGDCPECGK